MVPAAHQRVLARAAGALLLTAGLATGFALDLPTGVSDGADLVALADAATAASGLDAVEEAAFAADALAGPASETVPEPPLARVPGRTLYQVCRVTAYCDRGTTASGRASGIGQCAAPSHVPLGSLVYIPALKRTFIVTDRTHSRFRHNTVDVFVPSKEQSRRFGRRYLECEFRLPEG